MTFYIVIGEFYGHRSREAQTEFVPRGWPTAKRANDFTELMFLCLNG